MRYRSLWACLLHSVYRLFTIENKENSSLDRSRNCYFGRDDRSRIIDSQCEWGIRIVLFAKNNPLDCFLNAQTYRFDSLLSNTKKTAVSTEVETAILVEMTGVEPAASTSRTWRATICATSRKTFLIIIVSFKLQIKYLNNKNGEVLTRR